MMKYQVKLHPNVQKFLSKCETELNARIRKKLQILEENPFIHLEHYEGDECYKFRIGDYRALVDVDQVRGIVWIRVLDHRGRIYKRK